MLLKELNNFINENCFLDNNIISFPKVFTQTKTEKLRLWQIFVFIPEGEIPKDRETWFSIVKKKEILDKKDLIFSKINDLSVIFTQSGQEGGKTTISYPKIIKEGKNKGGKINETTPFTQALTEAYNSFKKKIKEGGVLEKKKIVSEKSITFEEILKINWRLKVMEYHNVSKGKNWEKVVFPCFVQTKLDGTHFTAVGVPEIDENLPFIDFYPRGGIKNTHHNHITKDLSFLLEKEWFGWYVCGELYKKGVERQDIISNANKEKDLPEEKLDFYVFDCFNPNKKSMNFEERWEISKKIVEKAQSKYIKIVECKEVFLKKEIEEFLEEKIKEKEEGIIIRNKKGLYEFGITNAHRTFQALKYKLREDGEFQIVGFKEGTGKMAGQIIFQAITEKGHTFWVDPKWNEEKRREWFVEMQKNFVFKGKYATIEYDKLSKDEIPLQPKLIGFKE